MSDPKANAIPPNDSEQSWRKRKNEYESQHKAEHRHRPVHPNEVKLSVFLDALNAQLAKAILEFQTGSAYQDGESDE